MRLQYSNRWRRSNTKSARVSPLSHSELAFLGDSLCFYIFFLNPELLIVHTGRLHLGHLISCRWYLMRSFFQHVYNASSKRQASPWNASLQLADSENPLCELGDCNVLTVYLTRDRNEEVTKIFNLYVRSLISSRADPCFITKLHDDDWHLQWEQLDS